MVLGVVLGTDGVAHTTCHGHCREAGGADEGIHLLLGEEVPCLSHEDTACDTEGEGAESAGYDAEGLHVDEGVNRHGCTHAEAQEDGGGIHHTVACCIEQTACVVTDFLHQVTEHEHTYEAHGCGHENGHNGGYGNGEDNLQHAHVLDLQGVGVELVLLLHVDSEFLLRAEQSHHQGDDYRHKSHVRVGCNGDGTEQVGSQLDGGEDGCGAVSTANDAK